VHGDEGVFVAWDRAHFVTWGDSIKMEDSRIFKGRFAQKIKGRPSQGKTTHAKIKIEKE